MIETSDRNGFGLAPKALGAITDTLPNAESSQSPNAEPLEKPATCNLQPATDSAAPLPRETCHSPSPAPSGHLNHQPAFTRLPAETPRAFGAFMAWFNLGQARSLPGVADKTGEGLSTLKQWSSRFSWVERLNSFQTGLLAQQSHDQAERQRKQAADWAARLNHFREQEWDAAQKLLSAAQCFLESFGDEQLGKMTLSQVSRALRISSEIGRSALAGAELPVTSEPAMSPVQQQILQALSRAYAKSPPPDSVPRPVASGVSPDTTNN